MLGAICGDVVGSVYEAAEGTNLNAISIGGDSDTIAAMAGSIAEPFYGIPPHIQRLTLAHLEEPLLAVLRDWVSAGKPHAIDPALLAVRTSDFSSSMA